MIFDDDQIALRDVARRFAREKLRPDYQKRESEPGIDRALFREMGSLGLIGVDLPEEYGGMGLSGVTAGIITEEIAYGDFNVSYMQLLSSLMGAIIHANASPELARTWNSRIVAGEAIVALGLTEPRGGSDAANLQLKARRVGDEYILSGEKTSITFADQADAMVLFARTGKPEEGARGISAFLVDLNQPGVQRTRFNDVGSKIIGRGSVFFDDVRVPVANRLGAEGKGFTQVMQGFDFSRILIALQCVAAAQASIDETWEYVKERQTFGAPLAQYQGVSFPIVEFETLIAACRQLCYHGLALRDAGQPHTAEAAMVKWMGPKTAFDAIHQCLLTFGHYGWSMDLPHQQRLRDVMGLEIGDGTAQIMKLIVARERVGRAAVQYAKENKS
ncbi:acyl-CoA dehydrogenase family protein [Polaromonas sp. JS666]|uniref:acyl-CoA dehydrogenase family protein n=1 Tax=Polaromonas sp. (strain JS666 / ATCC BAA-500) TaxID=296591 RepID=UPI00004646D7|nr:acyl-CoA dehydrogenase family protein [Polaromonas sp. JS666]ABE47132.1 acyl-CoA dehydrogenase-like [Polaromonas sp. JS666]